MIVPRILLGDLDLTAAPFMWEFGADFGGPEVVYETLVSMLRDGSSMSSTRTDNRQLSLSVVIEAADFNNLARYEAQLIAECDKPRNTLTFEPGDAFGAPSVFQTFRASAVMERDDDREQAFTRRWAVTIPALPYVQAAAAVVTPATPATPTYTLIDSCSSATGWTTTALGPTVTGPTVVSGRVTSTVSTADRGPVRLSRAGSVNLSTARYLVIDYASSVPLADQSALLNSTGGAGSGFGLSLATRVDLGGGLTRLFFTIPPGTGTVTPITFVGNGTWGVGSTLAIDQVQTSDSIPFFGTTRQKSLGIQPGGSVRTDGTVVVEHPTSALGFTMVHTSPTVAGYQPPLRPFRVSGSATTVNAANISGFFNKITTSSVFRVPATMLPNGLSTIIANLAPDSAAGTTTVTTTVQGYMGSTAVGPAQVQVMSTAYPSVVYYFLSLGRFTMPPSRLGPAGFVQITIQQTSGAVDLNLDEAWLLPLGQDCGLTIVECGTAAPTAGGASNRLWIEAATLNEPFGALWVGNAADQSDRRYPGADAVRAWGQHIFSPTGTAVFTATQNAQDASTSLQHFRRYHTHVST